jgi:hypothetical protein
MHVAKVLDLNHLIHISVEIPERLRRDRDLCEGGIVCSPNGSAFDVKVEIANMARVNEASFAMPTAGITICMRRLWRLEKEGMVWMHRVLYLTA